MNARLTKFKSLQNHLWYKKLVKKLTLEEISIIETFCETNAKLNPLEFEYASNRLYLTRARTKNFAIVNEILVVLSTAN